MNKQEINKLSKEELVEIIYNDIKENNSFFLQRSLRNKLHKKELENIDRVSDNAIKATENYYGYLNKLIEKQNGKTLDLSKLSHKELDEIIRLQEIMDKADKELLKK